MARLVDFFVKNGVGIIVESVGNQESSPDGVERFLAYPQGLTIHHREDSLFDK